MYRNRGRGLGSLWGLVLLIVAVILLEWGLSLLVPPSKAINAAKDVGYADSNIQVTDKAWFMVGLRGCGKTDTTRYTVVTTNDRSGEKRTFYVCASVLKGGTIRSR